MTLTAKVGVWSEAGRLRRVLVCAPGLAHLRLTPETFEALLFDDVMWVDRAKRDHFDFVSKMRDRGVEVLEFVTMLGEVVDDPVARAWVLDRKVTDGTVGRGLRHEIRAWCDPARRQIGGVPDRRGSHPRRARRPRRPVLGGTGAGRRPGRVRVATAS